MQFLKYAMVAYRAYRGDPEAAGQIVDFLFREIRARELAGMDREEYKIESRSDRQES